jgi:hypothetical protein
MILSAYICERCGQLNGREPEHPDAIVVCDPCRDLERAPQGETVKLFEPAPAVMSGQSGLF